MKKVSFLIIFILSIFFGGQILFADVITEATCTAQGNNAGVASGDIWFWDRWTYAGEYFCYPPPPPAALL